MKASVLPLKEYLCQRNKQFVIPIYQRNYDWNEEQCKKLLDDIIDIGTSGNKMHFIGSIVYVCNDEYTTAEVEKFVIIDGQQRITTITLMLIALYQLAKELGDEKQAEIIYEDYLVNKHADDEKYKIKLKATGNNADDMKYLLQGQKIPENRYSNIKNNFNFFKEHINKDNRSIVVDGFKRLLFVEIKLTRGQDNAQKIFESLNSTGLALSQADLIRNYILMELEPKKQEDLYNKYWEKIEDYTKVEGKSYVSDLIRDCLTIEMGEIPNKDNVFETFKLQHPHNDDKSVENVLQILLKYAKIFNEFLLPNNIEDCDIRQAITYIKYIDIDVTYPFLLQVMDDFYQKVIDKKTLLNVLQFVQTYVCRRFIVDLPTNTLNKIFKSLYRQVDKNDYEMSIYRDIMIKSGKARMPSDGEIRQSLADKDIYNSRSKMKYYILERLENYNNKEPVCIRENKDITVEHIFPQEPEAKWKKCLSEKDYEDFEEKYLHTIGNLTLSGNNGSLGNKTFDEKKNMNKDGKEQGYKFSRLWMNRSLSEMTEWTVENYRRRTADLTKRFISVWPLQEVKGIKETPETNILEIDDCTFRKIEYAVFFGEKINDCSYVKLYNHVIKQLYKLQPEGFVENYGKILELTESWNKKTRHAQLNSTYFYNTNLSAEDIIKRLKRLLEKMDLCDELSIKFKGSAES